MSHLAFAYRCGWCGMPCAADGDPMGDDAPKTTGETTTVEGSCCRQDVRRRLVSREMAMDAGDPDLEGTEL